LLDFDVPGGEITDEGLRANVAVGVRYLDAWLSGTGAAGIDNLMEDVATAEISRAQVWSWVNAGRFDSARVRDEIARVDARDEARKLFEHVALADEFVEFLTVPAYGRLQ
jgi:malate synthase